MHEMQIQAAWLHEEEERGVQAWGIVEGILLSCLLSLFGVGWSGLLGSMAGLSQNLEVERRKLFCFRSVDGFVEIVDMDGLGFFRGRAIFAVEIPEVYLFGQLATALPFYILGDFVLYGFYDSRSGKFRMCECEGLFHVRANT